MQFADLRGTSLFTVRTDRTGSTNRFLRHSGSCQNVKIFQVPLMKCSYRAVNEPTPPFTVRRDCTDCKTALTDRTRSCTLDNPHPVLYFSAAQLVQLGGPVQFSKVPVTFRDRSYILKSKCIEWWCSF